MVYDMDGWAYAVVDNLLRKGNAGNGEPGTRLRPGYGGQAREREKPGVRDSATRDLALRRNWARPGRRPAARSRRDEGKVKHPFRPPAPGGCRGNQPRARWYGCPRNSLPSIRTVRRRFGPDKPAGESPVEIDPLHEEHNPRERYARDLALRYQIAGKVVGQLHML